MLALQEYGVFWAIYYVAVAGLLMTSWRLLRVIPWSYPRRLLWLTVLVLLATPAIGTSEYWAPAWIIGFLELLFGGVESAEPAGRILLMVWIACIAVYTVISIFRAIIWRKTAR